MQQIAFPSPIKSRFRLRLGRSIGRIATTLEERVSGVALSQATLGVNQRGDKFDEQEIDDMGCCRCVCGTCGGVGASPDLWTRQPRLRQLLGDRRDGSQ